MRNAALAALACWTFVGMPVAAQSGRGDVVINMRGADIRAVAEQVARITGRTIVLDPSVQGTVNVVSSDPLTPTGVWDLFQSVLRVQGYAAVRSGAVWRVVPQAALAQTGQADPRRNARPQDVVTRLIRLRNLPSEQAVRVLRPLVAQFGSIEGLTDPNAIVVTDYAENVRRIELLAQQLDTGGGPGREIASITLRNAGAREVAQAIQRILGEEAAGGPRVAADERSNIVLVRGDATAVAEARRMAQLLDTPGGTAPVTRVFRLDFADAEMVADVIRGLLGAQGEASNPVARSLAGSGRDNLGAGALNRFDRPANSPLMTNPAAVMAGVAAAGQAGAAAAPPPAASPEGQGSSGFSVADLTVQPAPEINALVVRGSPAAVASLEPLIQELDVRRPQVMIEAAIVEITGDRAEQIGVQLGFGAASPLDGAVGGTSFSNIGLSLRNILQILGAPAAALISEGANLGIGSRDDFSILVQALGQSTRANLLSTPQLTTLDNEPAEIVVGQNVPFRTGSFATDGNTLTPFTTIEREDVGITLRVVPRVHQGDVVRLSVSQEVSSLVNANIAGAADLITNRRSIQTTVLADNGETIVLGGLITDDRLAGETRVPVLGDIPVVGALFRSRRESQTKRVLFVFLRPTILRDRAAATAAAQQQYYRLRLEDAAPERDRSLLLEPEVPRLQPEIQGVY